MTRSRASAKKAGATFERQIADALAAALEDDRIDRMVKRGNADRGDITGVRIHGQRLTLECKNTLRLDLPAAKREADIEAGNADALCGLVIAKRQGVGDPMEQWVHMTVRDLVALISGHRLEETA